MPKFETIRSRAQSRKPRQVLNDIFVRAAQKSSSVLDVLLGTIATQAADVNDVLRCAFQLELLVPEAWKTRQAEIIAADEEDKVRDRDRTSRARQSKEENKRAEEDKQARAEADRCELEQLRRERAARLAGEKRVDPHPPSEKKSPGSTSDGDGYESA